MYLFITSEFGILVTKTLSLNVLETVTYSAEYVFRIQATSISHRVNNHRRSVMSAMLVPGYCFSFQNLIIALTMILVGEGIFESFLGFGVVNS